MRSPDDIDIEVRVHKDRTTHRGDPDRLFPDFKMIDSLCHQTVGDSVVTPRAEVKRDIDQTFRTFKNELHLFKLSKSEIRISGEASRRDQSEKKMINTKLETLNSKQTRMSKAQNSKPYHLLNFGFRVCLGFRVW